MKQFDSLTKEQKAALLDLCAHLKALLADIKLFVRRERMSSDEARKLIVPILQIRGLFAGMRDRGIVVPGSGALLLYELEDELLNIEGIVKENRNEYLRRECSSFSRK